MWKKGALAPRAAERCGGGHLAQPYTVSSTCSLGLPWGLKGKGSARQCRSHCFNPWVEKIPWRRKRQVTPVFLLGEFHGQRSLASYRPQGHRESWTWLRNLAQGDRTKENILNQLSLIGEVGAWGWCRVPAGAHKDRGIWTVMSQVSPPKGKGGNHTSAVSPSETRALSRQKPSLLLPELTGVLGFLAVCPAVS